MRIDAHQHYWQIDRGDYGWITPELPVLYKDFSPQDLNQHLKQHRMDGSIVIQAAPTQAETEYILSISETFDSILGVVGWLDFNAPDWWDHFERFSRHPKFIGVRVMIQEMPDADAVLAPHFVEALRQLADKDVPVDLLVVSRQLNAVIRLLDQVPGLRAVIDHMAKPRISDGAFEPWAEQMQRISLHPRIYCKLSGMVTEADHRQWKPSDFVPYIRHITAQFGPGRIMFGSDWPVCLLAASYDQVIDVMCQGLPDTWGANEKAMLFGGNAMEFYKLQQPKLSGM